MNPSPTGQVILGPDHASAELLEELLGRPTTQVFDRWADQRQELDRLRPAVDHDLLDEPATWVYYPWRRSVVRILGPRSFSAVRLDRNRNKITAEEQGRLGRLRLGVVGLSVGHGIAHLLAMEGLCGELRLADFDDVALSNLNRIPATLFDLGLNKAVVTARRIAEIDPYRRVLAFEQGITEATAGEFMDGLDCVIEECDSLDVKIQVRHMARHRGIPVVMETSDRGLLDVERFDLEPTRPIFHGLLDGLATEELGGLSTQEKVPYVLRILEADLLSARMAASMAEVDHTVTTWPQLAGDVNLGAAMVGAAICRLGLGEPLPSGRVRVDLARSLTDLASPRPDAAPAGPADEQDAPTPDDITAVLAAAVLAPSGGNAQPWIFETTDSEIRLFVDPERTSGMDVELRGSYVAVGAALFNARVAASARGRSGSYRIGSAELGAPAATLQLGRSSEPELSDLYDGVMARGTNRRRGVRQALAGEALAVLRNAVECEGCHLQVIDHPAQLDRGAEILAASDRIRFLDQALHAEMMSELKWPGRDDLHTGIDVRTLELDAADLAKLEVARRGDVMRYLDAWNGGRGLGDVTRRQLSSASALALVAVDGASPASYVRGGMAVERFWVCAAGQGLALQPVSPVFLYAQSAADHRLLAPARASELEALSAQMLQLFAVGPGQSPVLVLRLSHAPPASRRSRRLPLDTVRRSHNGS